MRTFRVTYLKPLDDNSSKTGFSFAPGYKRSRILMTADDKSEIVQKVMADSGIVLKIKPVTTLGLYLVKPNSLKIGGRILQAIAFSVEGGLTPGKALMKVLQDLPSSLGLKVSAAIDLLRSGATFTDALKSLKIFDSTSIAMLESGEHSGGVKEAILATIAHIQNSDKALKAMIGAVSWTFIDIIFAISAIVGLRYQFLPKLTEQAKDIKNPSQRLEFLESIDISILICDALSWVSVLILLAGFVLLLGFQSSEPRIRNFAASIVGKIPGLGTAIYHASISASTGVAARMMKGGMPFVSTLLIAAKSSQLPSISRLWRGIKHKLEAGASVTESLQTRHFNSTEHLLIQTHTSQEQLAFVFDTISKAREEESLRSSKSFAIFGFITSLLYTGISVLLVLWVVYVQNKYLLQGLNV